MLHSLGYIPNAIVTINPRQDLFCFVVSDIGMSWIFFTFSYCRLTTPFPILWPTKYKFLNTNWHFYGLIVNVASLTLCRNFLSTYKHFCIKQACHAMLLFANCHLVYPILFSNFHNLGCIWLTSWLQIEIYLAIKTSLSIKAFIYKDVFI